MEGSAKKTLGSPENTKTSDDFISICTNCLFNQRRAKRTLSVKKTMPTGPQTNASTHQVKQTKKKQTLEN